MATEKMFRERMKEFCDLYYLCFNQKLNIDEVEWRYFGNPCAKIFAAFAIDDDKLVANYSVSPVEIVRDGQIYKAALSLNTMTHPDYSGRGLFVDLTRMVYKELTDQGYELVMGFPNGVSNRTFVSKLGWKDIYEIPTMELEISNISFPKEVTESIIQDPKFELQYPIYSEVTSKIGINKSVAYLSWKYGKHPIIPYHNNVTVDDNECVRSWIIYKEYQNRLNIVDYFWANMADAEQLLRSCIKEGEMRGKELLTSWSQLGTEAHLLLEKYGFKNNSPITYFGTSLFQNENADYYDYTKWNIQMGDDNVY